MKMAWAGTSGLAKAATVFAALLLICIGLCAGNAALFSHYGSVGDGAPNQGRSSALIVAGIVELVGIVVGAAGLIVVGIAAIVRVVVRAGKERE